VSPSLPQALRGQFIRPPSEAQQVKSPIILGSPLCSVSITMITEGDQIGGKVPEQHPEQTILLSEPADPLVDGVAPASSEQQLVRLDRHTCFFSGGEFLLLLFLRLLWGGHW
jgi:hypothetical protein